MDYIGEYKGYSLYLNNENFIEGYKTIGGKRTKNTGLENAKGLERIVTKASSIEDFAKHIKKYNKKNKRRKPTKTIPMYLDKSKDEKGNIEYSIHGMSLQDLLVFKNSIRMSIEVYKTGFGFNKDNDEILFRLLTMYTFLTITQNKYGKNI